LAVCITFFVTLKTYHAQVKKQEQLNALMKNPNARVAVGKKGKQIVKKLMDTKSEKSVVADEEAPAPKVEEVSSEIDELIKAAKAKKTQAKLEESVSELLLSGYEAPKIEEEAPVAPKVEVQPVQQVHYQLMEPMYQPPRMIPNAYPMLYPQNFEVSAPLPVPQIAKVAMNQPEPMREPQPTKQPNLADLPKAELIKALLTQLAKDE
jgi:hypothetical protein